jgi:hypothetical protein
MDVPKGRLILLSLPGPEDLTATQDSAQPTPRDGAVGR